MIRTPSKGFTLTELIVVIGILGILMVLAVPSLSTVLPKADKIVCMSRLRELWLKFAPCATEAEGWPQLPKGVRVGSREEQQFWVDYASVNLDVSSNLWKCPTISRYERNAPKGNQPNIIDYLPTLFDSRPGTPNKWPSMPWFCEIADVHGGGNLMIRSDGAVVSSRPKP